MESCYPRHMDEVDQKRHSLVGVFGSGAKDFAPGTNTGGENLPWFERLTGFAELHYEATRANLMIEKGRLISLVNRSSYAIGELTLPSLNELRRRALQVVSARGPSRVSISRGDVRALHARPEFKGALFQVASQFNALEMIGPEITPEHGVTRYENDMTQGPACAIATGAATVYRNYFVPLEGGVGQTATRQIDGMADFGAALSAGLARPLDGLWRMRNGYLISDRDAVHAITSHLSQLPEAELNDLRGHVCVALHSDVEVTCAQLPGQQVSQIFCSALPISYTEVDARDWRPFASLALEAAYEATLWAAVLNSACGASQTVLLTLLGGGVFGNEEQIILAAMRRALWLARGHGLDIRIVSYGEPSRALAALVAQVNDL